MHWAAAPAVPQDVGTPHYTAQPMAMRFSYAKIS